MKMEQIHLVAPTRCLAIGAALASILAGQGCSGNVEGAGPDPFGSGPSGASAPASGDPAALPSPVPPSASGGPAVPNPDQAPTPVAQPSDPLDPTPPEPGATIPDGPAMLEQPVLDSGRTVLRRLTAPEYNNTVRDLMFTAMRPADDFTDADTVADEGFDTIGRVLTMPPILFDQYEAAAAVLVDELFSRPVGDLARTSILTCEGVDEGCARSVLAEFSSRAFRRPVEPAEVDSLLALKATVDALGLEQEAGLKAALRGVLLSPHFVFRVEKDPVGDVAVEAVNQFELATRLSYFLWSSMPDPELWSMAEGGTLAPAVSAQVERMLEDEKASEFAVNFGGQWLGVRHMEELQPPSQLAFPNYEEELRDSAKQETLTFFRNLYAESRPLTEVLSADYTFADARLAAHYGIAAPATAFETVSLTETPRRGFLTQASFLMNSSHPDSTSPPRRGYMVLERFMCQVIPPAPPEAEIELPQPEPGMTRREQFALHSTEPSCKACHVFMDPIGFGFENFDAIGAYRTEENGGTIEVAGELPNEDGTVPFESPAQLAELLAGDPRFAACVTEKLLTYGVGRSFANAEGRAYSKALAQHAAAAGKNDWRSWLAHVATSEAFLTRRGEAE